MRWTLARRVALITFGVVLAEAAVLLVLGSSFIVGVRDRMDHGLIVILERTGELERCDQDPAAWVLPLDGVGTLFAVDDEGRPYAPNVPVVDVGPADPGRQPGFELVVMKGSVPGFKPFASLRETGRAGRCHRIVTSTESLEVADVIFTRFGIALLAILVLVFAVAWPLVLRIKRMAAATEEVIRNDFEGAVPTGDDELGQLGDAFNRAATTARERLSMLEARDEALRDALQRLTHDVMTPLASLKLGVERLDQEGDDPAQRHRALRADVEHLSALLANLATLARLRGSSLGLARESVDLAQVVQRVGLRMSVLAEDRGLSLYTAQPDGPVWVMGDSLALEQAVGNLVHNAVRYANGHVAVVVDTGASVARVMVRDDGPGIDPDDLPHVFEARFQGKLRPDGAPSGAGLGLAIVSEIAQRHEGRLWLEPYAEGGTEARLELPTQHPNEGS